MSRLQDELAFNFEDEDEEGVQNTLCVWCDLTLLDCVCFDEEEEEDYEDDFDGYAGIASD
jgi:hypothetical protein